MKTKKIRISKYDKIWSQKVRGRDKECAYCGTRSYLAAHHYIRRGIKATRLNIENGITLCPLHHVFSTTFSAHRTEQTFKAWFKKIYPGRARNLQKLSQVYKNERQAIIEFKEKYGY